MDRLQRLREALWGRYNLGEEIGRGGMAIVYRAEDARHARSVALKVLSPELAAAIAAERFLREIGIAARLQHPHILPLHDSGAAEGCLDAGLKPKWMRWRTYHRLLDQVEALETRSLWLILPFRG